MKECFRELMEILNTSLSSIEDEVFERFVEECMEVLQKGRKIIVSGLGKNVPICEKFVGTMTSLGLETRYMNTNSAIHGDLGMVREGDLVCLLTKSAETAESVYLYHLLKHRNVKIWLLTFNREGMLAKQIPNTLAVDLVHEGDSWNLVPNNSTTLNLIVLQMLAMQIAGRMGIGIEVFRENHPGGAIGKHFENC